MDLDIFSPCPGLIIPADRPVPPEIIAFCCLFRPDKILYHLFNSSGQGRVVSGPGEPFNDLRVVTVLHNVLPGVNHLRLCMGYQKFLTNSKDRKIFLKKVIAVHKIIAVEFIDIPFYHFPFI